MAREIELNGHSLIAQLNKKAMGLMSKGRKAEALTALQNCLGFLKSCSPSEEMLKLRATILNNLGCFYKDNQQPHIALKYLRKASKLEEILNVSDLRTGSVYVNVCVTYSLLNKHSHALSAGLHAAKLIEHCAEEGPNKAASLILAWHNVAVEYEHLSKLSQALDFYNKAWSLAEASEHPMAAELYKSLQEACHKYNHAVRYRAARERRRKSRAVRASPTKPRFWGLRPVQRSSVVSQSLVRRGSQGRRSSLFSQPSWTTVSRPQTASVKLS